MGGENTTKDESTTKKKTMPLWIGVMCVLAAASSLTFSILAYTQQYQVHLPFIGDVLFVAPELDVTSMSFTYNVTEQRYTEVVFDIKNTGTGAHTGTLDYHIYTTGDIEIASGSTNTGSIDPGVTIGLSVPLTWIGTYTVTDAIKATFQLQQTG